MRVSCNFKKKNNNNNNNNKVGCKKDSMERLLVMIVVGESLAPKGPKAKGWELGLGYEPTMINLLKMGKIDKHVDFLSYDLTLRN